MQTDVTEPSTPEYVPPAGPLRLVASETDHRGLKIRLLASHLDIPLLCSSILAEEQATPLLPPTDFEPETGPPTPMAPTTPKGEVMPTLQLPDGDALYDAEDMVKWLLAQHEEAGEETEELTGEDEEEGAAVRAWAQFAVQLDERTTPWRLLTFKAEGSREGEAEELKGPLGKVEAHLTGPAAAYGGLHLVSGRFTLADIFCVAALFYPIKVVLTEDQRGAFPATMRWFANCTALPSLRAVLGPPFVRFVAPTPALVPVTGSPEGGGGAAALVGDLTLSSSVGLGAAALGSGGHRSRLTRAMSISFCHAVAEGEPEDLLADLTSTPAITAAFMSPTMHASASVGPHRSSFMVPSASEPHAPGAAVFGCECVDCATGVKEVLKETEMTEAHRDLDVLLERNKHWRQAMLALDPEFFSRLAHSQSPKYLWIGCCDSRVPCDQMFGLKPGELFVHRNIANQVNAIDVNVQSAIQYAVERLKVEHIIICGHEDCGGIRASMGKVDMGLIDGWLRGLRDIARLHKEELFAIEDPEDRVAKLVELNVKEQVLNVMKIACVQRRRRETAAVQAFALPRVHGLVYQPGTGQLTRLEIDVDGVMREHGHIFDVA